MSRCFVCTKTLSNCYEVESKHCLSPLLSDKYTVFFKKKNFRTCMPCGKDLFKWNLSKNKIQLLKKKATCIICKQLTTASICRSCSVAMYNTSTCN